MIVKHIVDEWFNDYKKPSMFIFTSQCSGKCCTELGLSQEICHNHGWAQKDSHHIPDSKICERYLSNNITKAVVIGGLEPFDQFSELLEFIDRFRESTSDDIVIYTGYYPSELVGQLVKLKQYQDVIVKFGRFVPDSKPILDEVLGVALASENQYAIKIS